MAEIILFEDDADVVATIHDCCKINNHEVIEQADNLVTALQILSSLAVGELRTDAILLDSSLRRIGRRAMLAIPDREVISFIPDSSHGGDARIVLQAMNHLCLTVPVIGVSPLPLRKLIHDEDDRARITFDATRQSIKDIGEIITGVTSDNSR